MTTIAFIGLGNMGNPMAANLVKAGHTVHGFDLMPENLEAASRNGITVMANAVATVKDADVIITMVPATPHVASALFDPNGVAEGLSAGKIVVDTTVPLVPPKVARVQLPPQGSAAAIAAETLGSQVRLVTGFHNVSATKLGAHGEPGCDVLVFGDDVEAREQVVAITNQLGVRALHGGPLANAVAAEAMTSLLIAINKRYKIEEGAGIVITGIPRQ